MAELTLYYYKLSLKSRQAWRDMHTRHGLHSQIRKCVPVEPHPLWRIVEQGKVIVQAVAPIDWGNLPDDYLWSPPDTIVLSLDVQPGEQLGFELLANPTRRCNGKRVGADYGQWIQRQAAQAGVQIWCDIQELHPVDARKPQGPPMHFVRALFAGSLEVKEPVPFIQAVQKGFGTAKAFGFGLMLLNAG
jgi:hypothetical protein